MLHHQGEILSQFLIESYGSAFNNSLPFRSNRRIGIISELAPLCACFCRPISQERISESAKVLTDIGDRNFPVGKLIPVHWFVQGNCLRIIAQQAACQRRP